MPCRIAFAQPEDFETCSSYLRFRFLIRVRSLSYSPMTAWIFLRTSLSVAWSLYEMFSDLQWHLISNPAFSISNSADDSQARKYMDMTRERINFTFDPKALCYLLIMASASSELQLLVQSLRELRFEPSSKI